MELRLSCCYLSHFLRAKTVVYEFSRSSRGTSRRNSRQESPKTKSNLCESIRIFEDFLSGTGGDQYGRNTLQLFRGNTGMGKDK
jgi:hypothetical protein